jgi:hypothetical protein
MKYICALLALVALNASAANQAVLSWNPPTTFADGTPISGILTYNAYQGVKGQPKVKVTLASVLPTTLTVASGLQSGTTYCWAVTALIGTNESDQSIEACKTFPPAGQSVPVTDPLPPNQSSPSTVPISSLTVR